jgi:hypothetical protein
MEYVQKKPTTLIELVLILRTFPESLKFNALAVRL